MVSSPLVLLLFNFLCYFYKKSSSSSLKRSLYTRTVRRLGKTIPMLILMFFLKGPVRPSQEMAQESRCCEKKEAETTLLLLWLSLIACATLTGKFSQVVKSGTKVAKVVIERLIQSPLKLTGVFWLSTMSSVLGRNRRLLLARSTLPPDCLFVEYLDMH